MWLSLYLWACCNGVGCYLDRTRKYFGTVSQNAGYFSISLEYIFVVNWLRTLIFFFFFWFVTSHYNFLVDNYYMFFPRINVSVFIFSVHRPRWFFHITHQRCAAKKSLTVYECCLRVSECSTETWKKAQHLDSKPIILACDCIPKLFFFIF